MPKFVTQRWRIERNTDRLSAGFNAPGYPADEYDVISERWTRDGWEVDGWMGLDSPLAEYRAPEWVQRRAGALLEAYEAPPIDAPEVQQWIKRTWSHFRNCYRVPLGFPGAENRDMGDGYAMLVLQSRPFGGLPHVGQYGLTPFNITSHYAVFHIRKFYPEYVPCVGDLSPDCSACRHHINAHANGKGGRCTVIIDNPGYKATQALGERAEGLCKCPAFAA